MIKNESIAKSIKDEYIEKFEQYKIDHIETAMLVKAFLHFNQSMKDNFSIIHRLFGGMFLSQLKCLECGYISGSFENFTVMTVPIPSIGYKFTLDDCLKEFSCVDKLCGGNQWNCGGCKKKVDAEKAMYVFDAPEYLVVHLCRFKSDMYGRQSKVNSIVEFPINEMSIDSCYSPLHYKEPMKYELVATCNQSGSIYGGHYTANAKNSINNEWYHYDDETVMHIPGDKLTEELYKSSAYILFYQVKR